MDKRLKKILVISSIVLVVLIVCVLVINIFIENKLKTSLNNFSETIKIKYEDVHVNSLTGSLEIIQPKILVYGKTTHNVNVEIALNQLSVNSLSYWDYLFNDKISVENILLNEPNIIYHHNDLVDVKSQKAFTDFDKTIEVESVEIISGNVEIFNVADESLMLKSEAINFKISGIFIDKESIARKVPFAFKDYQLTYNNLFYQMNDFENLFMEKADFNTGFYKIQHLAIKTKFSHADLSNQISVERDHFDLTIDSVLVKNHEFGIKNDSTFYFESNQVNFYQPNFKIYRDKLVEDDLTYKPLYSKSLRNLNFDLALENLTLSNASIIYTEKVKEETDGGVLKFSDMQAEIKNLSNVSDNGDETSASIEGIFMENTPIKVDWNFDIKDINDEFIFKADIGKLNAEHMNHFMEPNLNVKLEGEVGKTYFTINGNDHVSHIDLKLQYDNFDIVVLKQNGKEKNKFLSAVVNLFVSSDSNDKSNEFRHGNAKEVERDKTKSVFNYLWLNTKAGLLNAMIGDGKKK